MTRVSRKLTCFSEYSIVNLIEFMKAIAVSIKTFEFGERTCPIEEDVVNISEV